MVVCVFVGVLRESKGRCAISSFTFGEVRKVLCAVYTHVCNLVNVKYI